MKKSKPNKKPHSGERVDAYLSVTKTCTWVLKLGTIKFGPDHSLLWGDSLCIFRCLLASLAFTH